MVTQIQTSAPPAIHYPDSDGQPMADNTEQFRWIVTLQGGLDALFQDDPNIFVAGDLLWYPVEGNNKIRVAPDAMVIFGRPKGKRGSYLQWKEDNIAPQVVFEVLSPGNTLGEMARKLEFYRRYGVEEYYLYDPDSRDFSGWTRQDQQLIPLEDPDGWVSPRLGIRFVLGETELEIYTPAGRRFATYVELEQERRLAEERATAEAQRADRLAAKLRELGLDPDRL
ncbi:MAG: Uma2 family endonuclease [Prochlorothrix sp.]